MQSNGGNISLGEARKFGVRCILSGPAGGVIGARYVSQQILSKTSDSLRAISFDMGGTSTYVSLIDGDARLTTEASIGGCPISIPVIDIHTIGAGGGSIAQIDPGGALRVGPESAGANPGPACYGRGDPEKAFPTVTDANLILGRLDPDYFLGGKMHLDTRRARHVLTSLGKEIGLDSVEAALGAIEVVNTHMERALRLVSVERGHDPHDYVLISFGGAGGLHASELAHRLGIPRVIVPPQAAALSAFGMLAADVVKDYSLTVMLPGDTPEKQIIDVMSPIIARGYRDILAEGVEKLDITIDRFLDMRYQGQSFELTIPFSKDFLDSFHTAHQKAYGFHDPTRPVEIVNIRVRAVGKAHQLPIQQHPISSPDPSQALLGNRQVHFPSGSVNVPLYYAELLLPVNRITGPARIVRADTTIVALPGDHIEIDPFLNLIIEFD